MSFLYILDINPLSVMNFFNYFLILFLDKAVNKLDKERMYKRKIQVIYD
jgi:hypothetical protein